MAGKTELLEEMIERIGAIPLECQEHILNIAKAMAFTRRIVESEYEKKSSLADGDQRKVHLRDGEM